MQNFEEYYIMGCGVLGQYLKNYFSENEMGVFLGFLDNNLKGENIFIPEIIKDKTKTVIVASINYMYEMYVQLKSLGYTNIINFAGLTLLYPASLHKFDI